MACRPNGRTRPPRRCAGSLSGLRAASSSTRPSLRRAPATPARRHAHRRERVGRDDPVDQRRPLRAGRAGRDAIGDVPHGARRGDRDGDLGLRGPRPRCLAARRLRREIGDRRPRPTTTAAAASDQGAGRPGPGGDIRDAPAARRTTAAATSTARARPGACGGRPRSAAQACPGVGQEPRPRRRPHRRRTRRRPQRPRRAADRARHLPAPPPRRPCAPRCRPRHRHPRTVTRRTAGLHGSRPPSAARASASPRAAPAPSAAGHGRRRGRQARPLGGTAGVPSRPDRRLQDGRPDRAGPGRPPPRRPDGPPRLLLPRHRKVDPDVAVHALPHPRHPLPTALAQTRVRRTPAGCLPPGTDKVGEKCACRSNMCLAIIVRRATVVREGSAGARPDQRGHRSGRRQAPREHRQHVRGGAHDMAADEPGDRPWCRERGRPRGRGGPPLPRPPADGPAAQGAARHPRVGRRARLPAQRPRDRRRGRARSPPRRCTTSSAPWSARATCAATPTAPARSTCACPRSSRTRRSTTPPTPRAASPRATCTRSPRSCRCWATSRRVVRSSPSRPWRACSRCRARSSARARSSCCTSAATR